MGYTQRQREFCNKSYPLRLWAVAWTLALVGYDSLLGQDCLQSRE